MHDLMPKPLKQTSSVLVNGGRSPRVCSIVTVVYKINRPTAARVNGKWNQAFGSGRLFESSAHLEAHRSDGLGEHNFVGGPLADGLFGFIFGFAEPRSP